jgi:hypothetical protein
VACANRSTDHATRWPTRGPNVGWTIGSTRQCQADSRVKKTCN